MKHSPLLTGYLERMARACTNQGAKVVVGGRGDLRADVFKKIIYIPAEIVMLDSADRAAFEGALDHEMAHIRAEIDFPEGERPSDFLADMGAWCKTRNLPAPAVMAWLNAIEDVRIERVTAARWIGAGQNMHALHLSVHARNREMARAGQVFPAGWQAPVALYLLGYDDLPRHEWAEYVEAKYVSMCEDNGWVEACRAVTTPREAFVLAGRIVEWLATHAGLKRPELKEEGSDPYLVLRDQEPVGDGPDEPPPNEKGDQGDNESQPQDGDGEPGDGDGEGGEPQPDNGEPDDEGDEPQDGDESGSSGGEGEDEEGDGSSAGDDEGEDTESGDDEGEDEAAREVLEDVPPFGWSDAAKESVKKAIIDAALGDPTRDLPHPRCLELDKTIAVKANEESENIAAKAAPFVRGVVTKIVTLLRLPAPLEMIDQDAGMIDPSALAGVVTGHRRIFYDQQEARALDTAVEILIDCSGSMYGTPLFTAKVAAYCMGEALNALGVPFQICGWYETGNVVDCLPSDVDIYTRFEPRLTQVAKSYSDPWIRSKGRVAGLFADGCNDDAGAVLEAARRLLKRPEKNKLLIVLSDGMPASNAISVKSGRGHHRASAQQAVLDGLAGSLRAAVRQVEATGIRCGGIGILTDAPAKFYRTSTVVQKMEELPVACVRLVEKLVAKGRR